MFINNKHLLEPSSASDKVVINLTTNSFNVIDPDYLIVHYTATDNATSPIGWFKNNTTNTDKIAAHIVLDIDGTITQMVAFNKRANHAGYSTWDGVDGMNQHAIGIELVNPGFVEQLPDGSFRRQTGTTTAKKPIYKTYPASIAAKLIQAQHKNKFLAGASAAYWFAYPQAQLTALYTLSKLLIQHYQLVQALGHDDVSPVRKPDPGPAFNWAHFKQNVLGSTNTIGNIYLVATTDFAAFRTAPSTNSVIIKKLTNGYEVGIIETVGTWCKVYLAQQKAEMIENGRCVKKIGWIHSSLLIPKP